MEQASTLGTFSVEVRNSTSGLGATLQWPPQFAIDIGSIDVMGSKIFTKSGTPENYTTKPGNYYIRVTVKSSASWESGDIGGTSGIYQSYSNAEIYSGTRVAVIYPKFLANMWASAYADDAYVAQAMAGKPYRYAGTVRLYCGSEPYKDRGALYW